MTQETIKCPSCQEDVKIGEVHVCKPKRKVFDDLGANAPTFQAYFDKHEAVIRKAQALLATALSDELGEMDRQIREIEPYGNQMASIMAWADGYLDVEEHVKLVEIGPRSSDFTDMDREKALAAAVVRQRRFRDVVEGIGKSVDRRISYAQSRLRNLVNADKSKVQG